MKDSYRGINRAGYLDKVSSKAVKETLFSKNEKQYININNNIANSSLKETASQNQK